MCLKPKSGFRARSKNRYKIVLLESHGLTAANDGTGTAFGHDELGSAFGADVSFPGLVSHVLAPSSYCGNSPPVGVQPRAIIDKVQRAFNLEGRFLLFEDYTGENTQNAFWTQKTRRSVPHT